MVGTIFIFPAVPAQLTPQEIGTEVIGGRTWTTDIRVTRNGAQDHVPQITVDSNHDAHILWQSSRSPTGYYYVKLNRAGELLSQETFITSKVLTSWGAQYPYGPTIDIDSQENLHVTFDFDYMNVGYAKFDYQGNVLVPEKKVGPVDGQSSHTPSLAVGLDDTVHISNEDYKFQCEDLVYHKLANDGSEIWTNRVVSSDVASHVEFDIIKASHYSGNFLFTFGSSTGTWLGRMDKYGVKNMPSVKIRPETDYKIADVTETPNGDMHLVWFDPTSGGRIHYTRVNASGIKVQDNIIISPNAVNAGMPRIAATSSGLAVVVWEDKRNGNFDIYYAVIDNTLFGDGGAMTLPENVRLTQQSNDQIEPWIAIDPDDNFHVAWTDMRDGNQEIYYKFMFNFALELFADPIELANLFFIHPNETKVLPMFVRNKGGLADSYAVDLAYTPGAIQDGWRIDIDRTYIESLNAGEVAPLNLTVHAPSTAKKGDHVMMTINASSQTAPGSWDVIQINTYVQVTRALTLRGPDGKPGNNGETISFAMVAQNTGDVREDQIDIHSGDAAAPQGWTVTTDKTTLALDPKETGTFTVSVTVPEDTALAPANMVASIGVTLVSVADSTVTASKAVLVQVNAQFQIQMHPDLERQFVDPGQAARYTISIANVGNLAGQAQIAVAAQDPSQPGWTAALDRETVFLRGGESTDVQLTITVPANAIANSRLTVVVSAFAVKFGTTGQTEVTTFVNRVYGLDIEIGASADIRVGRVATFPIHVTNTGNGDETLSLAPYQQESGWSMSFAQNSVDVQSIFVPHGEARTFEVRAQADSHATAGLHVPVANIIDSAVHSHLLPLPVKVTQFFSVELTATEFKLAGSPSKTLQYDLELKNLGNGRDNFTLSVEDLAAQSWFPNYQLVVDENGDLTVPVAGALSLGPAEFAKLRLFVTVPRDLPAQEVQFTARATSAAGEQDSLLLVAQVKLADLAIDRVDYSPSTPVAGQITAITLAITNTGDIEAQPIKVEFYDKGSLIATDELTRIAAGQRGFVTFAWLPTPGEHDLKFIVDPPAIDPRTGLLEPNGLVFEKNELDNTKEVHVSVGAQTSFLPGFDGAFTALAVVAGAVLVTLRRRRD
jgi:uncharacterized repeat protein (TIGR01451 family)